MAAVSSQDRFAIKSLRITYQELLELANALEKEKKGKPSKRRSKDDTPETSSDTSISPTKINDTLGKNVEESTSNTKKTEKRSKDDKKTSKKRDPDKKKKHKDRSPGHGEKNSPEKQASDENLSSQNVDIKLHELNDCDDSEQQQTKDKKKHRKHRSSKLRDRNDEETADFDDSVGKLQIADVHNESSPKDSKAKKKSKSKEEKSQKHSEKKGKTKHSHVEESNEENVTEHNALDTKEENDSFIQSKQSGILKSPNSKSSNSNVRVSFSEETDAVVIASTSHEERGILRIPQGVNIYEDESRSTEYLDGDTENYNRDDEHIKKVEREVNNIYALSSSSQGSDQRSHKADSHEGTRTESSQEANTKLSTAEKRMRALNKQRAQQLTKQAHHAETALTNLLSKGITDKGSLNKVFVLSNEIQDLYKGVIMLDLSFAQQQDIDQLLWKNAFYQVIETFRKYGKLFLGYSNQKNTISPEEINAELKDFLENSKGFYTGLVQGLQKTYHFDVEEIAKQLRKAEFLGRSAKLALLSCHHTLIFIGDIERYKEQLQPSTTVNWSGIRSWYLKASKLAPKNGKPYNQLAVIAVYANRKLDAVFYYVRSLSVNSPILTAKEKLTTIFHEIQKKADQLQWEEEMHRRQQEELKAQQERGAAGARGRGRNVFREAAKGVGLVGGKESSHGRQEIWVFLRQGKCRRLILTDHGAVQQVDATGRPITREQSEDNEKHRKPKEESPKISLQEVNKKLMLHFLCAHGLLYTRIGMERLPALQVQLIGELQTLLRFPQCSSVGRIPLLQMSAINMYAIEHTASREDTETFVRLGTPQDQALKLSMDMLISVLNLCTEVILSTKIDGNHGDDGHVNSIGLSATLRQYIPTIKVWFDWMVCYQDLWQASNISIHRKLWEAVAHFANALLEIELSCFEEDDTGEVLITLNEDEFLAGFKPLSDAQRYSVTINSTNQKELVEDHLHVDAVKEFATLMSSSTTNPTLRYCEETSQYTAVISSVPASPEQHNSSVAAVHMDVEHADDQELYESDEVIIESVLEDIESGDEADKGFKELKAKKDKLAKELEDQEGKHTIAKAVIHENMSRAHLVFENCPNYLVSDTNCFIDQLSGLQAIIMSTDFTLIVPIVVINELDGLKKDLIMDKYRDLNHAQMVMNNARAAIDFLEDQFSQRSSYVKALTSKGNVMDTIAFRSEDTSVRKGNNDDVILSCCLHYCEENFVNRLAVADQPITIRRNVVLLTDDRNLRVKAYTRNVPVLTVPQFRQMARL